MAASTTGNVRDNSHPHIGMIGSWTAVIGDHVP